RAIRSSGWAASCPRTMRSRSCAAGPTWCSSTPGSSIAAPRWWASVPRRSPPRPAGRHASPASPGDGMTGGAGSPTSEIVLATINARYQHASLGLRYLMANAGDLRSRMTLREFTLGRPVEEIAASLLALQPRVIGLAVYIWNVVQTQALVERLKAIAPQVRIVLGGPEVSHETESQPICRLADHVVQGPGDLVFAQLARQLLDGGGDPPPRVIAAAQPELASLALPYHEYDDIDVRERVLYVEASRG